MATGMRPAKRPLSSMLAGPYGHPFHPMLVTVPIGAWVISLGFDVASHWSSRPSFLARGSEWLIAVGVIGAIVAGLIGLLDLAVIPQGTPAFRTACTHMYINVTLIVAYGADFAWRFRTYSRGAPVNDMMIALSAACVAALAVSGYLGGKLAYRYGIRVAAETTQAEGYLTADVRSVPGEPVPRPRRGHRAQNRRA